jgi:transposase-like protein
MQNIEQNSTKTYTQLTEEEKDTVYKEWLETGASYTDLSEKFGYKVYTITKIITNKLTNK